MNTLEIFEILTSEITVLYVTFHYRFTKVCLSISLPFAFSIRQALGRCTPAIGCEITDLGKTVDVTNFQHNGQC
jgi:hypothetical protein